MSTILGGLGLTTQASQLEQQYGLPPGLLTAQAQQEGGYTNGQNNYSSTGAYGLAQVLPSTAANPGYGVTPITMQQAGDPATALTFMAQYDAGRIKAVGGDVDAGLSGYSGGAYTASSLGVQNGQLGSFTYPSNGSGGSVSGVPDTSGQTDLTGYNADRPLTIGNLPSGTTSATPTSTSTSPFGTLASAMSAFGGGGSQSLLNVGPGVVSGLAAQTENFGADLFMRIAVVLLGLVFIIGGLFYFGMGGRLSVSDVVRTLKKPFAV